MKGHIAQNVGKSKLPPWSYFRHTSAKYEEPRDVVHFGYNDCGDDMISFLIEKPDRRDIVSAEANLLSRENFPRNTETPGRSLVKIEVREVMQIMVKTKKVNAIPHVAYKIAATTERV